ncbi:hypothetical protein [Thiolapillus sp.]|uniref:hypothetical protein n=1 Tax=Thiolapillus sp. TaxID=2017437 RepID=UPI003AF99868
MRTTGKQCSLAPTGDYQPSLRSPWLAASARSSPPVKRWKRQDPMPMPPRPRWKPPAPR